MAAEREAGFAVPLGDAGTHRIYKAQKSYLACLASHRIAHDCPHACDSGRCQFQFCPCGQLLSRSPRLRRAFFCLSSHRNRIIPDISSITTVTPPSKRKHPPFAAAFQEEGCHTDGGLPGQSQLKLHVPAGWAELAMRTHRSAELADEAVTKAGPQRFYLRSLLLLTLPLFRFI